MSAQPSNTAQAAEPTATTHLDDLEAIQRFTDEQHAARPFIGPREPLLASLEDEFRNGSPAFVRKARWLARRRGFDGLHRTRGDGDCFYRSLAFQLVYSLLHAQSPQLVERMSSHLASALSLLEQVGYDRSVTEDFWEPLRLLLSRLPGATSSSAPLDGASLLAAFNDAETTNSIVVFLRLSLSAWLKLNTDKFSVFLFALDTDTGEPPTMNEFCSAEVEPVGKEADHLQIAALADFLGISLDVAYFSRTDPAYGAPEDAMPDHSKEADSELAVDIVEFRIDDVQAASARLGCEVGPLGLLHVGTLLYRPGHYDILIKP